MKKLHTIRDTVLDYNGWEFTFELTYYTYKNIIIFLAKKYDMGSKTSDFGLEEMSIKIGSYILKKYCIEWDEYVYIEEITDKHFNMKSFGGSEKIFTSLNKCFDKIKEYDVV